MSQAFYALKFNGLIGTCLYTEATSPAKLFSYLGYHGLCFDLSLGEGDVNYERLIPALYQKGYRGPLIIEREIEGEKQITDILIAKKKLERIRQNLIKGSLNNA